jgi:hypothetical protein
MGANAGLRLPGYATHSSDDRPEPHKAMTHKVMTEQLWQRCNRLSIQRVYVRLARAVAVVAIAVALSCSFPANSWAIGFLGRPVNGGGGNQGMEQAAQLVAPEPDGRITVYLRPEAGKAKAGYGVSGDTVTVLEHVSDNQSVTWNHIRFEAPPYAEGWVQDSFIALRELAGGQSPNQNANQADQKATGDRYLGNRSNNDRAQRNQQSSPQSYSQQNHNYGQN